MEHTPGPWHTNDQRVCDIYARTDKKGGGRRVATTSTSACYTEEDRANADLIARTPALYLAAKLALLDLRFGSITAAHERLASALPEV